MGLQKSKPFCKLMESLNGSHNKKEDRYVNREEDIAWDGGFKAFSICNL